MCWTNHVQAPNSLRKEPMGWSHSFQEDRIKEVMIIFNGPIRFSYLAAWKMDQWKSAIQAKWIMMDGVASEREDAQKKKKEEEEEKKKKEKKKKKKRGSVRAEAYGKLTVQRETGLLPMAEYGIDSPGCDHLGDRTRLGCEPWKWRSNGMWLPGRWNSGSDVLSRVPVCLLRPWPRGSSSRDGLTWAVLCSSPGMAYPANLDLIEEMVEVFMDDFSVYGASFSSCLSNLCRVLQRCEETI
ncbi:unnamed protein product [Microthlaspi erraticum]|uniref:Uncharacterized protein n=1 Tax=Microthlaspi erraticum TaxID=1685480 RepID=A0A6D2JHB4_9BRAS|nr:unnamed protein product [Microthlaspi erraticum]